MCANCHWLLIICLFMHANSIMAYISKLFLNDNNWALHNKTINEMESCRKSHMKKIAQISEFFFPNFSSWKTRVSHMNSHRRTSIIIFCFIFPIMFIFWDNMCLGNILLKYKEVLCTKNATSSLSQLLKTISFLLFCCYTIRNNFLLYAIFSHLFIHSLNII